MFKMCTFSLFFNLNILQFLDHPRAHPPKSERSNYKQRTKYWTLPFFWSVYLDVCRSPEEFATIKQKMVYSASKDKFQRELGDGLAKVIQANDSGDLEWDNVLEQISRHDRN